MCSKMLFILREIIQKRKIIDVIIICLVIIIAHCSSKHCRTKARQITTLPKMSLNSLDAQPSTWPKSPILSTYAANDDEKVDILQGKSIVVTFRLDFTFNAYFFGSNVANLSLSMYLIDTLSHNSNSMSFRIVLHYGLPQYVQG